MQVEAQQDNISGTVISKRQDPLRAPLTKAQEQLLFFGHLAPDKPLYNLPSTIEVLGALDEEAFERTLKIVVEENESLRTTIQRDSRGGLYQLIEDHDAIDYQYIDLQNVQGERAELDALRIAEENASKIFDLSLDVPARFRLIKIRQDKYIISFVFHHIFMDGPSLCTFFIRISKIYSDLVSDGETEKLEKRLQYGDYSAWREEQVSRTSSEKQLDYWKKALENCSTKLDFPLDKPRPAKQTYCGEYFDFTIEKSIVDSIQRLVNECKSSIFQAMLTAFELLLVRYSGQQDVLVGVPVSSRHHLNIDYIIGMFADTVVMRLEVDHDATFPDLLKYTRQWLLNGLANGDCPFQEIVREFCPERDLSRTPMFQVMFTMMTEENVIFFHPELVTRELSVFPSCSKCDMTLTITFLEDVYTGRIVYNTDVFDKSTIERLSQNYIKLLESIINTPNVPASILPILNEAQRCQLLEEWNCTATDYGREVTVTQLFKEMVAKFPNSIALEYGETKWTYREIDRQSDRIASFLQRCGEMTKQSIGVWMQPSAWMIASIIGILKTGAAYVPIDMTTPEKRLLFLAEDASLACILTEDRHEYCELTNNINCYSKDHILEKSKTNSYQPNSKTRPDDCAYLMYTSGSTGQPKGVLVPHRAIIRLVKNTNYVHIEPDTVIAQISNPAFDAATFEIWGALLNGARLVGICREHTLAPEKLSASIAISKIDIMFITTALFNQMAYSSPGTFNTVGTLLFGGETADPAAVREILHHGGPDRLINVYGPTENTTFSTWHLIDDISTDQQTIPIGKPISNTTVYILDSNQQPVPFGVCGELYLGGDGVALGYHRRPELNGEKFVPNPFDKKDASSVLYRTGDIVRWKNNGSIEFVGRKDFQIKIRGFRIEIEEIESILRKYPGVQNAAIVVDRDVSGNKRLLGFVTGGSNGSLDVAQIREYLKLHLPGYMIPAQINVLPKFPLNQNGKIDRHALTVIESQPDAENKKEDLTDPLESQLISTWCRVLKLSRIGVHDSFFDLGGHSLLSIRLVDEIERELKIRLPLSLVFEIPTIAQMASAIHSMRSKVNDPLVSSDHNNELALKIPGLDDESTRHLIIILSGWRGYRWSSETLLVGSRVDTDSFPLFWCVQDHDEFSALAKAMSTRRCIYGMTSGYSVIKSSASMCALAAHYAREINSIQPTGPIFMSGYCLGGLVILEVARELRRMGRTIGLLTIVERSGPSESYHKYLQWRVKIMHHWNHLFSTSFSHAIKYIGNELYRFGRSKLNKGKSAQPSKRIQVSVIHQMDHRVAPYDGNTLLYFVRDWKTMRAIFPMVGWEGYLTGRVRIRRLPGDHESIKRPSVARLFARQMDTEIRDYCAKNQIKDLH